MPIKGVLLQAVAYAVPEDRPMWDVDLLVLPRDYRRVQKMLLRLGLAPVSGTKSWTQRSFRTPDGMVIDLHRELFSSWRYRMPASEVFARSRPDSELFGIPVARMHGPDVYAHLIGKITADHGPENAAGAFEDLRRLATAESLAADSTAAHLRRCGVARAAAYVLAQPDFAEDPFAQEVLDSLSLSTTDELLAARAAQVFSQTAEESFRRPIAAHLLNTSLPRGIASLTAAAADRAVRSVRSGRH